MGFGDLLEEYWGVYLEALWVTYELTLLSFAAALVLGTALTVMRVSPAAPLRLAAGFYIQVFRNIPGITLLIFMVYALPNLDIMLSYFACVLWATAMIVAAFCSDYLMSGINAVPPGQIEAARSLGMGFAGIVRVVVLPQALRSSVLPLTNLLIATMLTTAMASQIPLKPPELTGVVAHVSTYSAGSLKAFLITSALYCATALAIGLAGNMLHRRLRIPR